jgi:hypothetical protein
MSIHYAAIDICIRNLQRPLQMLLGASSERHESREFAQFCGRFSGNRPTFSNVPPES